MSNNKKKKGTKKVKPSDYDIPGTIRKIKLFPGESGIDKKLGFDDMDTNDAAGKGLA